MSEIRRLAIIDRGEPAVRVLAAVRGLARAGIQAEIDTTVVTPTSELEAWWSREAGETLRLDVPVEGSAEELRSFAETLRRHDIDAVWPGSVPLERLADLVDACTQAGMAVVGPDAETIRRLLDRASLADLADRVGIPLAAPGEVSGGRRLEVDTLCDAHGAVWTLGLRETSIVRDGHVVMAEYPAPDVSQDAHRRMCEAAGSLMREVSYSGAAVVGYHLGDDDTVTLLGVEPVPRALHAALEECSGASLTGLQLEVELGARLEPEPPRGSGHTIEARLLAQDPEHGFAPTGGRVELLSLPVGTGVRVDASLRVGDHVDAEVDPTVAVLTSWGRDRPEAYERLEHALERTTIVMTGGATTRTRFLELSRSPEVMAGSPGADWYTTLLAAGAPPPPASPVAVLAAAVEVYQADLSDAQRSFRASAERGRPQHPEQVGQAVRLDYRGSTYRLRVDRVAADTYRIRDGVTIDVVVDWLSDYERRLTVAGTTYRVVAIDRGDEIRLEVDGRTHLVTREDGTVVRTPSPALIERILVSPGQDVAVGQPVAVLESMKMVSTVTAPLSGQVTSVAVLANQQVEAGDPLLRIKGSDAGGPPDTGDGEVDLASVSGDSRPRDVFTDLRNYLLGYDLEPGQVKALLTAYRSQAAQAAPGDTDLMAKEDALLDLFAEVGALYRPRTEAEANADPEIAAQDSPQEFFIAYVRWLDAGRAGLPARYRTRLERALARYGATLESDRAALSRATYWMFRSFERVPELAPLVAEVLARRLRHAQALSAFATTDARQRLERLAAATDGRQPIVADAARDTLYAWFDEPVLAAVGAETEVEMRGHLAAIAADPDRADRGDRIGRLVWSPQPARSLLLRAWRETLGQAEAEARGVRQALLETYIRRFYRIRNLHALDFENLDGVELGFADYEYDGKDIHLVVAYAALADVPALSRSVATHLAARSFQREAVVDLVTWRDGDRPDIADLVQQVGDLVGECDFGRVLHRLDLTITSLSGEQPERDRTQHLTFRQGDDGRFVEELIYRNLHPMLGKRLDLWRLSNFDLRRLPSPEDVYLFDGVAKDNPKDHRLFALAEVRDLTPVHNESSGQTTYPRLGRIGLAALAAMRQALATYPARQRPTANRLVLSVRPTWTIPQSRWHDLAQQYEGLARGASMEKLILHISLPEEGTHGQEVHDKILVLEGLGKGGLTVRLDNPGPNPVRPLTAYAQKVLTAARFGSPYPYEIVRMLTPGPGDDSPFPRGSWQELDLGADDTLVPVEREPGQNSAHLVVGLLTSYTEVHPEGMTRVAMLSDPTQGLGNLSEPECRRINAVLAYALERRIPVEWYAVSSGALIAMDSGTENMDWIALTLRRLIEYTQAGGEINILITGITVGGQPYWNAEATMLMHTKGILIMTPASTMVLTGKQALDFSGAVSADDNQGIGGYDRVMGPNGQAQYWAPSFPEACSVLLHHYDFTYVVPGERFPRRRPTDDPVSRDVRTSPHAALPESPFTTVGDVFDVQTNPERKQPFDMRSVMRSVSDTDCEPLERWKDWEDGDTVIVWDATVGGIPVCMIGLESHTVRRKGFVPSYGPPAWTSGTLFPQSSRKCARAVNATSDNRPLVVLANLSGFDGSPESMRGWQLEYGAEIGRAITNFQGPIVFVVVSRYHGGAFVVFSKALTESMEIAAVEGSFASVIGGAPAAATVFAREVKQRTERDSRVTEARAAAAAASGAEAATLRATAARVADEVRSERLREVADEFDAIHTIERAMRVGSVDRIIAAETLRPYVIDALERGMSRALEATS